MNKDSKQNKVKETTKSIFQEWWEYSRIIPEDSFLRKVYKVLVRILGIVLIIIFSPAIAIVLLVAFLAVV